MGNVRGYTKRDGTRVRPHTRRVPVAAGAGVLAVAAVVLVVTEGDPFANLPGGDVLTTSKPHHVARVVDGDTLVTKRDGHRMRVRVLGIDTPETVDPDKPVQCGGRKASRAARRVLADKTVRLIFDDSQARKDKYGRTLAYVELPGGADYGLRMLRRGHAHEYTYRTNYQRQDTYRSAEKTARRARKGLWQHCPNTPH